MTTENKDMTNAQGLAAILAAKAYFQHVARTAILDMFGDHANMMIGELEEEEKILRRRIAKGEP